ncbi:MAG: bifunctional proline dehydrogenase/L-glutamate gamma-semialdehyde dehydrogenase PutA [Proteobacteria bacterium]|nr:bifunctional proline dehydrogenase/L-glutamate gamma-semialdehyde dehydrogenase PutA [Pseudomonadota bacterium]
MLFSKDMTADSPLRQRICDRYIADESSVITELLAEAQLSVEDRDEIARRAQAYIVTIRKQQTRKTTIDIILNEYSLTSDEGRALMSLAEALLRVPDKYNAHRLLQDKLIAADWQSHIGLSRLLRINLLSRTLALASTILNYHNDSRGLKRFVSWCSTPLIYKVVRHFIHAMANQFVLSQTIAGALLASEPLVKRGYNFSYDMLGESARCKQDEQRFFQHYVDAINTIGASSLEQDPITGPGISVKLSALHSRYCFAQHQRVVAELIPRLKQLALLAKKYNIGLTIDAEESARLELSLDIFKTLFLDADLAHWQGFGFAVQAYQKRATVVVDWLVDLASSNKRQISVRLVKGAYWDSEIKWAQQQGLADYPVFTNKAATDVSYLVCARKLLNARAYIYPQFATHNAYTVASILQIDDSGQGYEFQRLHQMGEVLYDQIIRKKHLNCRVYAPIGKHIDLLAYLIRRMLENGANSSFVNNIVDTTVDIDSLLIDPVLTLQENSSYSEIPLPKDLYQNEFSPPRLNARGFELADKNELIKLKAAITPILTTRLNYLPPTANLTIHNPADLQEIVGAVIVDSVSSIEQKLQQAKYAFLSWSNTAITQRCQYLDLIADQLEDNSPELIALCIKEAGKTLADSMAEVREAVDFCRYYSRQAEQLFADNAIVARGVVLCISPWNFPLAIFVGQLSAALVTGNTVLAKAAEQTSLIAQRIVELIYQTGLDKNAVQLIIGAGMPIGKRLIPDERIQAVMFTGSCETALWINQALANRKKNNIPFIAETGGQNAMIVDSTAQLEHVVDDVISSGFNSAGQRCSSLRVVFVQHEIAESFIALLKGAMAELTIADPQNLDTDIGPIIDQQALDRLNQHCDFLYSHRLDKAKLIYICHLKNSLSGGHYFAPRLYEINSLDLLDKEVFGPIVHLIRFKADELDNVVSQINQCGYGLTLGIHSRLTSVADYLASNISVGNVYINRNMVGAVVGVQPFGGRARSGTGPKAGGKHYLEALVKPRNQIVNMRTSLAFQTNELLNISVIEQAKMAWLSWHKQDLEYRVKVLTQLCSEIVETLGVTPFKDCINALELMQLKIRQPNQLPGPTGELNQLYYESRGIVVVVGDKQKPLDGYMSCIITALLAGNVVICAMAETDKTVMEQIENRIRKSGLPRKTLQFLNDHYVIQLIKQASVSAVISPLHNDQIKRVLAQRSGPIIPLIYTNDTFWMNQLLLEKTVSTDTTAAIGNALLLSQ